MRALNDYEGAVILISHDRHLIDACADRLWIVRGGTVRTYDGDMDSYRAECLAERGGEPDGCARARRGKAERAARLSPQEARRQAAEPRAALAPLRKKVTAGRGRDRAPGRARSPPSIASLADGDALRERRRARPGPGARARRPGPRPRGRRGPPGSPPARPTRRRRPRRGRRGCNSLGDEDALAVCAARIPLSPLFAGRASVMEVKRLSAVRIG